AVDAMTRRVFSHPGLANCPCIVKEIYHKEFIPRLMKNEFACIIKMMDLTDNLSTDRLVHLPMETMHSFLDKYANVKQALWEKYVQASMSIYGRVL
ncbi:unnamed protein product, partial [marine sediment metagenome]